MKDLREIASNEGLQVRETVKGGNNGYPSGFEYVITDFFDWEQIEDFVKEYGGTPIMLHKRDGWQMWERCDKVYEPMEITAEMYGDNYEIIYKDTYEDFGQFIKDFVVPQFEDKTTEQCKEIGIKSQSIWSSVESIKYRNAIIPEGVLIENRQQYDGTWIWEEIDTIDLVCIEWSHDTHNYMIGVMFNNE